MGSVPRMAMTRIVILTTGIPRLSCNSQLGAEPAACVMPDPHHDHLRRLFDKALDLPPAARQTFLDSKCGTDVQLKQRLMAMLLAADDEQFLTKPTGEQPDASPKPVDAVPAASPRAEAREASPGEGPGSRIGPYRLLQQIGEGGFGIVFMAEQSEPVQRRVALKVIKLGMDTRQVVARFEQERQALAMMDHPNIAKVLDAGATSSGRPFFVMDLVKGDPITSYCDKNHLSIDQRLRLFAQVCQAVQHAHGKGIIHRDIKPSNILVGTQDGRPSAKVIDFGIAKATSQKLTDKTVFTEHQQVIGTLQYMSPEQAEGSLDIDTRTDVYSLGILLYELLTGSTPFDKKTLQNAMYGEVQRMIREVDPPRPSTRLSESLDTLASIAAQRRSEPKRLGTLLRGDLDWIVMKALEKDRARRYETANGLAADILRHLGGEAVVAAPPSASYRLRKFVRRNRGTVTALAAVAVSLLVGAVAFAWQARIATHERNLAVTARAAEQAQRELAESRSAELAQVATFQERMLGQIDATATGARLMQDIRDRHRVALAAGSLPDAERTARTEAFAQELARANATDTAVALVDATFLTPAVAAVDKQFAQQPLIKATLQQTLATLYVRLGTFATAHTLQTQAVATRERLLGPDHLDTARSRNDLANVLENQGKYAEAEPRYRQALAVRQRQLGDEHPDTLVTLGNLGNNLRYQHKLEQAEPLLLEALRLARKVNGPEHRDTLIRTDVVGYLRIDQGRIAEAEPYWRETYATGVRGFGPDDPDTITWTNNLGGLIGSLGRAPEAEQYYREAWAASRRVHGEQHPNTLNCAGNVANNLVAQARFAEAEPLQRETLASRTRSLGPEHPDTLLSMTGLGTVLRRQGKLAEAEPLLRSAWTINQRVFGGDQPQTLRAGSVLASLLVDSNQPAAAEALFGKLLPASARTHGNEHPDHLILLNNLGNLLVQQGRLAEAEPLLRDMLAARQRVSGPDHPETLIATSNYARLREDQGQLAEAEALYRDATQRFRRVLGDVHPNTLSSINNVGGVLLTQLRFTEAEPLLREALAGFQKTSGESHLRTAGAHRSLGRALVGLQRFAEAEGELLAAERTIAAASTANTDRKLGAAKSVLALYEKWNTAEPGLERAAAVAAWQTRVATQQAAADSERNSGK